MILVVVVRFPWFNGESQASEVNFLIMEQATESQKVRRSKMAWTREEQCAGFHVDEDTIGRVEKKNWRLIHHTFSLTTIQSPHRQTLWIV